LPVWLSLLTELKHKRYDYLECLTCPQPEEERNRRPEEPSPWLGQN